MGTRQDTLDSFAAPGSLSLGLPSLLGGRLCPIVASFVDFAAMLADLV